MNTKRDQLGEWEPLAPEELLCGKYSIGHRLGAGAMGIVYYAEHVQLRIPVAIKVMRVELSGAWGGIERMLREARAAARLRSEHVVRVLDVGRLDDGLPFIVMEYLEGADLAQMIARSGKLSLFDAIDFVIQACDGIAEAHSAGIVHRDLKPENLFLTTRNDGSPLVKVFDFGVSKELGVQALRVTEVASAVGSPAYMSPEQVRAESELDCRADIWALGVVLTELCTGQLPFSASTLVRLFEAVQYELPRLPTSYDSSLPSELDDVVRRCLQQNPEQRYADSAELAVALQAILSQLPNPSRVQVRRRHNSSAARKPPSTRHAPSRRSRKRVQTVTALAGLAAVVAVAAFVSRGKSDVHSPEPSPIVSTHALEATPMAISRTPSNEAAHEANVAPAAESPAHDAPAAESSATTGPDGPSRVRSSQPRGPSTSQAKASSAQPSASVAALDVAQPDVLQLERAESKPVGATAATPLPWDPESFGGRR